MNIRRCCFSLALVLAANLADFAQPLGTSGNLVINGDFENAQFAFLPDANQVMVLPPGSEAMPNWTVINGEVAWVSNSNPFGPKAASGTMFLDLTSYHDAAPYGGIAQTIVTVPGQHYQVSVALGSYQDNPSFQAPVSASVIVSTITNDFTLTVQPAAGNLWQTFTIPYVASSSSTPIRLQGSATAGGQYIGLDNVSFKGTNNIELLQNGSFENTSGTFAPDSSGAQSLQPGATAIPGWTVTDAELAWVANANHFGGTTPTGDLFLDLTGYHDNIPYGGVIQTVSTTPGQQYQLTFSIGADQDVAAYRGPVSVTAQIGSELHPVTLVVPGTGNQWQNFRFDFQATAPTTRIQVIGKQAAGGNYLGIDNVQVFPSLRISNPTISGGDLLFDIPQGNYIVESTTDLKGGPWSSVNLSATSHTDGTSTISFPLNTSEKHRFFRLRSP